MRASGAASGIVTIPVPFAAPGRDGAVHSASSSTPVLLPKLDPGGTVLDQLALVRACVCLCVCVCPCVWLLCLCAHVGRVCAVSAWQWGGYGGKGRGALLRDVGGWGLVFGLPQLPRPVSAMRVGVAIRM